MLGRARLARRRDLDGEQSRFPEFRRMFIYQPDAHPLPLRFYRII